MRKAQLLFISVSQILLNNHHADYPIDNLPGQIRETGKLQKVIEPAQTTFNDFLYQVQTAKE
ncbi:hypothetical protein HDF25_004253 [Pedobacter cryoconitis]|uniref:Uncharacterized protein n=1 Tax=Pedobacter cryoconitis TaxID=188932 RepID=A0A7X0J986_9SPHI|nr:hypothetical protein [Pedobacter cryoconitis]